MASKASKAKQSAEATAAESKSADSSKKAAKKTTRKTATRKSRAKSAKEVRLKAFWGVFNQSLTSVAMFEYSQQKEAKKKAEELSESKKSPHFVQLVKKVIEE
jgi:hypothetical protein